MSDIRGYINTNELAERWGVSVQHLKTARFLGGAIKHPEYYTLGRKIYYKLSDIKKYESKYRSKNVTKKSK